MNNELSRFDLRQIITRVSGAAGVNVVEYVVPVGYSVRVVQAVLTHDDVAARDCVWRIFKGAVEYNWQPGANVASGIPVPLYGPSQMSVPEALILRAGATLRGYVFGLGAGKIATIDLYLEAQLGGDTYGDY